MRLQLVICGIFLVTSAAAKEPAMSWREALDFSKMVGRPVPYSIIKDILLEIIGNFKGERNHSFDKIEINSENRFENVTVKSVVPDIELDMVDKTHTINIKKLSAPINLLEVKGNYTFEGLILPGGLTLYGNGKFTIRFEELQVSLRLAMKHSMATGLWTTTDVGAEASQKSFLFEFKNLMDGEPMGDFLCKMVNELIPVLIDLLQGLVEENKDPIMKIISDIMNKIMELPPNRRTGKKRKILKFKSRERVEEACKAFGFHTTRYGFTKETLPD